MNIKSYYKIKELDEKYNIIKNNILIIELGCFPGGWSKYINSKKIKKLIKIDLKKPIFLKNFIKGNFFCFDIYKKIFFKTKYQKPELIISDLCPKISKSKFENKILFKNLLKKIFLFSNFFLKKKGSLLFKSMDYVNKKFNFLSYFKKIKKIKLICSKKRSSEIFYICKNFLYEF
ncbi:SAM-dependent methyltransferase [Candidatus Vidania fulgoroideorum]